jgi:hypothetical protein
VYVKPWREVQIDERCKDFRGGLENYEEFHHKNLLVIPRSENASSKELFSRPI